MKGLAIAGLVVIMATIVAGCSCFKDASDVSVSIRKITLSKISFTQSTVDVAVWIENRNPVGATLEKIEYDIYLGRKGKWIWLARGGKDHMDLGVNDSAGFLVTTTIDNTQLLQSAVDEIFGTEPSEMKVDGHAWFKVGPAEIEVHFDKKDIDPFNPLPTTQDDGAGEAGEGGGKHLTDSRAPERGFVHDCAICRRHGWLHL